ncbi:MAG: hypothetical protein JEZ03_05415 [Bacteroidales bacterium]|nr:hypothetical protein [Bacteroidales bacterium]
MKTQVLSIILMAISILVMGSYQAKAQEDKKKETRIKIIKEVDGKKTVMDTVFYSDEDVNLKAFLGETVEFHKFMEGFEDLEDIQIDINEKLLDSLHYKIKILTDNLDATFDEDFAKKIEKLEQEIEIHIEDMDSVQHIIMDKMIIAGDGFEKIIHLEDGRIHVTEDGDENIEVIVEIDGDEEHVKIFRDGKHISTSGSKVMVISNEDHDAEFITVDVILDDEGKETKNKMVIALSNLNEKEKAKIQDLGISFKKKDLKLEEFSFTSEGKKNRYEIGFILDSRGDVEVEVFDTDGKSLFKDIDKDFNGEYKGKMKLKDDGDFYLIITQAKTSSVNKLMIETIK